MKDSKRLQILKPRIVVGRITGIALTALLISQVCSAQESAGIRFANETGWAAVTEKAKSEGKFIFVDVYTTWCGPCKFMADKIFPTKEVGDFFNKNFINIKIQMDTTKKDDAHTKSWYKDAQMIAANYNIGSYPTYLFFSPEGNLVNKIPGSSPSSAEFLEKVKTAIDPKKTVCHT